MDHTKKYFGQQCQDDELNMKFRDLHVSLVNHVIAFCVENNILIDEFHMCADSLEESIKAGSWQACTDSALSFEKFTQEYKDVMSFNKVVSKKEFDRIRLDQEPFMFSM